MSERSHEDDILIKDLSSLVRRLVRRLQRQQDQSGIAELARDFLIRKGLNGVLLRAPNSLSQIEEERSDDEVEAAKSISQPDTSTPVFPSEEEKAGDA